MPTKHNMVSLSESTKAIILGSLLGDGSLKINPKYMNARFSFRHSIKQKDYFFWKTNMLKEISGEKHFWQQPPDGLSKVDKLRYQSLALPSLSELYRLTHKGSSFDVRRKWLNEMSSLSLAIWWLDDGSIISNQRKGVICTDGFTEKEVKLISQYLKVVWHINAPVGAVNRLSANGQRRQVFRIWFRSTDELKKFLRIIAPHVQIKSMLYKIMILYKEPILQQRWISELAELTGFSEAELTAIADQRKAQLKKYQKKI